MKNIPSDFELLKEIYLRYYEQFTSFNRKDRDRQTKTFVPIDIEAIAKHFKTDEEIIFGRLYLHLDRKYGYKNENDTTTPFFSKIGPNQEKNVINFPHLASVIAGLREERNRHNIAIYLSIAAFTVSLLTFALNGFTAWKKTFDVTTSQKPVTSSQELKQDSSEKL